MKKNKFLIFMILTIIFTISINSFAFAGIMLNYDGKSVPYNADPITLKINDKVVDQSTLPMQPIIIDGTTLVPVREVFEALGAIVDYKDATKEVFVGYNKRLITMAIDDKTYYINENSNSFSIPPKIINNKTMIPLRAVSEGMGLNVSWDNSTRTISISEKTTTTNPETPTTPTTPTQPTTPVVKAVDKSTIKITESATSLANVNTVTTNTDSIIIKLNSPVTNVTKMLLEDNRLVLDFINTNCKLNSTIDVPTNSYYTKIRSSQFQTTPTAISRVVLQLNDGVYFSTVLSSDRTQLKIFFGNSSTVFPTTFTPTDVAPSNPTVTTPVVTNPIVTPSIPSNTSAIYFDPSSHSIVISKLTGIAKNNITIDENDAFRKNITVNFKSDYSSTFGNTKTTVTDTYINSYTPSVSNGVSKIDVKLNSWGTLNVTENSTHIIISFIDPHKLYDKILVIDAGHGGIDSGTTGNGMYEKNLNLTVALQYGKYIEENTDIKVYYTRTNDVINLTKADINPTLLSIGPYASAMGDFLFSVHTNGLDDTTVNGLETLYANHTNDATVGISSLDCAKIVQRNLVADTGLKNRGVIERPNLAVLRLSTIPAVLGEMGFIKGDVDSARLADSSYLTTVAKSYARSTIEIFSQYTPRR